MRILQVTSPTAYEVLEVPTPQPGPGEILMRVEAVNTCPQWDLHLRHNEPMFKGHQFHYPYTPGQPGHEATGRVEAVGPEVSGLVVGDRVSAWRDQGHNRPGCYAQYVVMRAENVLRVPEGLPDAAVASLELAMCLGTPFRALRDLQAIAGRIMGLSGLGPAGLIALQMARAEGAAAVYGFDPLPDRRQLALQMGADGCYDPRADNDGEFPVRPARPRLQTAVDCHGGKTSVEFLMDRTSQTLALFGVQRETYSYQVRHAGLWLLGYGGHGRESAEYALALIATGKLDLTPLTTRELPLEKYGEGIDLLEQRQALKICFRPWD